MSWARCTGSPIPIKDTEAVAGMPAHSGLAPLQGPYRRRRFTARGTDKGRWPQSWWAKRTCRSSGTPDSPKTGLARHVAAHGTSTTRPADRAADRRLVLRQGYSPLGTAATAEVSIRIPASFSGLYGIKGTQGTHASPTGGRCLVPPHQTTPREVRSHADVRDSAVMMNVMAGPAPRRRVSDVAGEPARLY